MSGQTGNNPFLNSKGLYEEKDEVLQESINRIIALWDAFLVSQKADSLELNKDFFIHKRNLFEVVKRLDKRRTYYYVFHGIEEICEYKELGVMCYWINTLKPFMVVNEASSIYNAPNEMFCIYIIFSALVGIYKDKYPKQDFNLLDKKTIQDYVYNFKYCDLDREAMIFFVETLAKSYGIGMETNAVTDKKVATLN